MQKPVGWELFLSGSSRGVTAVILQIDRWSNSELFLVI